MINMSMPEQETLLQPRIVVFGVGGAGSNAIGNMIRSGLEGVHFVAANTDAQALSANPASKKLQLGPTVTRGLGAGARPDLGREAAEEQLDEINALLENAHMVFITAGMGGGTGTGAAPVIARAARERGILTVGVVTKPFQFEGAVRMRSAEAGIEQLQQYVDTLIVIPNQNLFNIANEKTTWSEAFKLADDVLYQGVRGVTDLIMTPGQINLDFADIRSVMSEMGKAMMGTGEAEGENRARQAAEMAINNPLLDDASVKGARGVLINITGGPDLTLFEVEEAADRIRDEVDPDANIIFGTAMDENLTGKIRISVVATGIDSIAKRAPLTVVGGNEAPRAGQPQSAYVPAQGQMQGGVVAQAGVAGPLFSPGIPAAATGTTAQVQNQAVRAQSQAPAAVATLAQPSVAGNGMTNFYSGMTAEQVGNTLRAPAQEQPVRQAAQATAPVRGTRQGDQFVAPAPVQAGRPAQQMQPSYQVPLQGLMPVDQTMAAQPTARKQGFGERMLGKVKKLVSQLDTESQGAQPQAQMQQPVQQPRAGYEVSHGGRAGLPPVADEEIDIPSFLRRQAN